MRLSQTQQEFLNRVQQAPVTVEHEVYETAHGTIYSWRGGREMQTANCLAKKGLVKVKQVSHRLGYYAQYSGSSVTTYQVTAV